MNQDQDAISERWDQHERVKLGIRPRWWKSRDVWRYVNWHAYGIHSDKQAVFNSWIEQHLPDGNVGRAVSIGSGKSEKELSLLKNGVVGHFDLFDLSSVRRDIALETAKNDGLEHKLSYTVGDAFERQPVAEYDMVYWHAALHHMFDVPAAVAWSKTALKKGGVFAFHEFVGPTRFQWPDRDLDIAHEARRTIPQSVIDRAAEHGHTVKPVIKRPTEASMIAKDPSESVDSERILPAIIETFPNRNIKFLGGLIYMLALGDAVLFVKTEEEKLWLRDWLNVDRGLALAGRTYFACGVCRA